MRPNYVLGGLILAILVLAGCTSGGNPVPVISPTMAVTSSTPAVVVPSPTPTLTPTLTPTATSTATPLPSYRVTLEAVGDINLARSVGEQVLAQGPQIVFADVQSVLDEADIRVGNLECAITSRDTPEKKSYPLRAPPQAAQALAIGKFDILSLANNHAMDYGYAGLTDTQAALEQFGILSVGAGENFSSAHTPVVIERNGLRLAFLAYVDVMPENSGFDTRTWMASATQPGIAWADPAQITADVTAAKRQADLVVVLLHSGYEINTTVSEAQRSEAHAAIDAGAVLVVGSHPHILQTIEQYHGGLIAYSLGNFVFDEYLGVVNASIILRVVLDRSGVVGYDYIPVLIENGLPGVTPIENVRAVQTLIAPVNSP